MPTLTNISGVPRALPLISKKYVEFAKGETKDFPDADWAAIKSRISVAGDFRVEGKAPVAPPKQESPETPVADEPAAKTTRAKKG
jgi:hypothetical protein